ncbi:MAG: hypothetical protein U9R06_03090 [Patescibacteria group bacterium]|nr:hypothetical protein [Patescibacteria group bacterium]
MSLYRDILAKAWHITWRYKYLWFFGLFAALLGNGGELELIFRGFNAEFSQGLFPWLQGIAETGFFNVSTIHNIGYLLINDPITILTIFAVFLIVIFLSIFLIWLVIVSQAALVNNAANSISGKSHDFKDGLAVGMKKFWPVLGLNVLIKIVVYLLFVLISLPGIIMISRADLLTVKVLFVLSFIIFIPISIILAFIVKYAIAYAVIKGSKISQAIKEGWDLFVKNWLVSLEMAFILFFINFVIGLGLILVLLIISVPFLFLALLLIKSGMLINFGIFLAISILFYLAIIAIVGAALATFQISSWTGLFIKLVGRGGASKLARVFGKK